MTQDEVDLIYDYLHENYRYEDGDLIRIKSCRGQNIGKKLMCYIIKGDNRILNIPLLRLNGKRYRLQIQFLIYIYFNKTKPRYLSFLDENPVNTKIENIISTNGLTKLINPIRSDNKTGIPGISIARKKYQVNVRFNKRTFYCGNYISLSEAEKIKSEAEKLLSLNASISQNELHKLINYSTPSRKRGRIKKFIARIVINKRGIYLGSYNTKQEAHEAYLKAKKEFSES